MDQGELTSVFCARPQNFSWFPVMDAGEKSVGSGGEDRAALDDFSVGILPFVPKSGDRRSVSWWLFYS
jgi:hypothetical protein